MENNSSQNVADFLERGSTAVPGTVPVNQPVRKMHYSPEELKILVDALNGAPSYLSKRFILKHLCGWSDAMLEINAQMKKEEQQQSRIGDKTWL
jgi:hypothetical protein